MSERHTLIRSLHDLGLAAWFGGMLMGKIGVNGAAAHAEDPVERLALSSLGWAKWAPVQIGALTAHAIGGIGLVVLTVAVSQSNTKAALTLSSN